MRELLNLSRELQNYDSKSSSVGITIHEFKGKLSKKDIFHNPHEDRSLILRILNNYKFKRYFIDNVFPNVLVIFNDREYVCTIKRYNEADRRYKYEERLHKNGFYIWELRDSYTVGEIVKNTSIKDFINNRITIETDRDIFDKLCDQYNYKITVGLGTHAIYNTPPEKISDPYSDTVYDAIGRFFKNLIK